MPRVAEGRESLDRSSPNILVNKVMHLIGEVDRTSSLWLPLPTWHVETLTDGLKLRVTLD